MIGTAHYDHKWIKAVLSQLFYKYKVFHQKGILKKLAF